jgi:hypothetical protein
MLSFASHQHSANARFGLWDAWQAVLSALTWPNVGMRFEVSTLSGPDFPKAQRTRALTIVKAKKTEKRSSSQDTHARAVGSAAALAIDADDATSGGIRQIEHQPAANVSRGKYLTGPRRPS